MTKSVKQTVSLLAVLAFALTMAPSAVADEAEASTAVPLDFPVLQGALDVAEQYWAVRGVQIPPLEGAYELPAEERFADDAAFSELPGRRIWLAGWLLEELSAPTILGWSRVRSRADLCYLVIHERGHNAGLRHANAGTFPIMAIPDEVGPGWLRQEVAPRCWTWARHPFHRDQ